MTNIEEDKTRVITVQQDPGRKYSEETRVADWYRDLKQQLTSLEPYLKAGRIVTFQNIAPEEKAFFEEMVGIIRVPEAVCAVFIPPSIVQQAMWPGAGERQSDETTGLYSISPDAGAVAAQRCGSSSTIVNALFAFPPLTPGVDVYEEGRLLAGYTFKDHRECANGLSDILNTYLT